jgi:hypothetical protein
MHLPRLEDEDARRLHRELMTFKGERTGHINRVKGWLIGAGIAIRRVDRQFLQQLKRLPLRLWTSTISGTRSTTHLSLTTRSRTLCLSSGGAAAHN